MRRVFLLTAITALATARPELYKEKEDFQFSRTSSDEGTKSGYYDAQRGNMGGNYERAHNMDSLAQNQMGGLVRTVEGELGDGVRQKSGSVFTAANSRGVYGSGHYDMSNLQGRNFQEGTSYGNSQLLSSSSSHNSGYGLNSHSTNSGYHRLDSGYSGSGYQTNAGYNQAQLDLQRAADNLHTSSQQEATRLSQNTGYYTQSGYRQSDNDQNARSHLSDTSYRSNVRLVSTSPVRVYVRPGSTVNVPIAAQTVDTSRGLASNFDQNAINSESEVLGTDNQQTAHRSNNNAKSYDSSYSYRKEWEKHNTKPTSTIDHNAITAEAEVSGSNDQHTAYQPTNNGKHYESSYSYRKEWEKHGDIKPVSGASLPIPAVNPYPINSELNEDSQSQGSEYHLQDVGQEAQNVHSSNSYNVNNIKSGSTSHQSAYSAQQHRAGNAADNAGSSSYSYGANNNGLSSANLNIGDLHSQVESITNKPKSYQSSYSYHKSWERQGDPYIIKPATNGQYFDAQASQRLSTSSLNQGATGYGSQQYGSHYHQGYSSNNGVDCDEHDHSRVARSYNLDQQSTNVYEGQRSQNLEDFGQESQRLEDFGQQSQTFEDFGQQSQKLEDFGQQSQKLEDFGQQSQKLDDFGQQSQKLEDFGQKSQNIENFGQQSQNLEDFSQQSQNINDFSQQSQQTQNHWDQQSQTDLGQETQNTWNTLDSTQESQNTDQQQMEHTNHHPETTGFEQQENIFEVTYPTNGNLGRPSHTIIEDSRKPFFEGQQDQKKDTETEFGTDSGNTHTHYHTWNYQTHNHNSLPQPLFPNYNYDVLDNQRNSNTIHILNTSNGNIQHVSIPSNNGYSSETYKGHNGFEHTYSNYGENTYTNTQTHVINDHSSHSFTHIENPSKEPVSLNNLWNLLDDIEKQTTSKNESDSFESPQENKHNVQYNNYDFTQNVHKNVNEENYEQQISISTNSTESPDKINIHDKDRGDIGPEKILQNKDDIGRGDIGPEDSEDFDVILPLHITKPPPTYTKPYKTPEEIETISLTSKVNKTTVAKVLETGTNNDNAFQNENKQLESELSVLSIHDQKLVTHHNERDNWKLQSNIQKSTTPNITYLHPTVNVEESATNKDIENTYKQSESFHQQNNDLRQQFESFNQHNSDNVEYKKGPQQNVNQQFETIGKQDENEHQHSFNHFQDFGQQSENVGQEHQQHVDFNQQSENIGQEHQQLVDFGQQSDNLGQEHQKHEDFSQQSENIGQEHQQLVDFGQQSENLGQEHQQIVDFGQQSENIGQEHQQLVDFGQQSDNLGQEHQKHEDFSQQSENLGQEHQQLVDFGQQSENLGQEHQQLVDFGQQSEKLGQEHQQLVDFGQQSENLGQEHQQLVDFGHQSDNLGQEHQKHEDFSQQSEIIGQEHQQLVDFRQQRENLGQDHQNPVDFGQHNEGFQQENTNNLGQQKTFQQESLPPFEQNEKLGQTQKDQVLQDYVPQLENVEHQSQVQDHNHNQQGQNSRQRNEDIKQENQQVEIFAPEAVGNKESRDKYHHEPIVELSVVTQKSTNLDSPPEAVTEKVGFWNKVGSKITTAKDKVASWFSRG